MKKELLEHLVRLCVREVIEQSLKEDETKGAAAPPADGQGTADQPAMPKENPEIPEEPEEPENLSGAVFINPRDKSKLQKIPLSSAGAGSIERVLHKIASSVAGPQVKVSMAAQRMAKEASKNPNTLIYFYLGKYDPNSDEVFLMADKSLQIAKDASLPPSELGAPSGYTPHQFEPTVATSSDYANRMSGGSQTPVHGVDENGKLSYDFKKAPEEDGRTGTTAVDQKTGKETTWRGRRQAADAEDYARQNQPSKIDENLKKAVKKMISEILDK